MPTAFVGFPATVFTGLYETLIPGNPEVLVVLQRPRDAIAIWTLLSILLITLAS